MLFSERLHFNATTYPSHCMVIEGVQSRRYGELYQQALGIANALNERGVSSGDCIAIVMDSSSDYLALLWALMLLNCCIYPLSLNQPPKALTKALTAAGYQYLITGGEVTGDGTSGGVLPIQLHNTLIFDTVNDSSTTLNITESYVAESLPQDDDSVLIFQSSGSTGHPKTYAHSRVQFEQTLKQYDRYYAWGVDDRLYLPMPLNDTVGCYDALAASMSLTTLVLAAPNIEPRAFVADVKQHHVTHIQAMPWHIRHLLDHPNTPQGFNLKVLLGGRLFPQVKEIHVSTDYFSPQEKHLARKRLCKHVYEDYGCSELWLMAKEDNDYCAYPESVGRVIDDIVVEAVDEHDQSVPLGQIGRLRFQAPYMTQGYINHPKASQQHFKDGWFYPGDEGYINKEGYLFFCGRADDLIALRGAKFYPSEVEQVLRSHKQVAAVAVMGCTSIDGYPSSIAAVQGKTALQGTDLQAYCGTRLASWKVPEQVVVLSQLPKTRSNKIAKKQLKALLIEQGYCLS